MCKLLSTPVLKHYTKIYPQAGERSLVMPACMYNQCLVASFAFLFMQER